MFVFYKHESDIYSFFFFFLPLIFQRGLLRHQSTLRPRENRVGTEDFFFFFYITTDRQIITRTVPIRVYRPIKVKPNVRSVVHDVFFFCIITIKTISYKAFTETFDVVPERTRTSTNQSRISFHVRRRPFASIQLNYVRVR